ncbi:CPBP family intramembrane glutamic endopeptidase [Streptomyces melanogenes]|uniref:CPBP family intramembrane glutamic endopeptidase n=1 Tax=Streptomyces melanogenes TaxID=67326 RepID=UPI0037A420A9
MHAYLVAVMLVGGLAPMALASHLHGRWIEPREPYIPTLAVFFAMLGCLAVLGLVVLGPRMITGYQWWEVAVAGPVGWLMATATWRCDRWVMEKLATGQPPRAAGRPRTAPRTARTARPVGIGAGLGDVARPLRTAAETNRWGREERSRETRLGLFWLVTGAVLEELVYRGVYTRFAVAEVVWPLGVLLLTGATLAFTLSHLPFGWPHALAKLPLSLMALVVTLATGSVLTAVVGHAWFNVRVHRHYRSIYGGRGAAGA